MHYCISRYILILPIFKKMKFVLYVWSLAILMLLAKIVVATIHIIIVALYFIHVRIINMYIIIYTCIGCCDRCVQRKS